MKIKGDRYGESYYEQINECISDEWHNNTEQKVESIMDEFSLKDIERVLIMLIDDRKKLMNNYYQKGYENGCIDTLKRERSGLFHRLDQE